MSDVFLSYSKQDQDAARLVARAIERSGLSVFHEAHMALGARWDDAVRHQIESAGCILVPWSKAAAQSEWVERDIQLAVRAWSSDRLVLARLDDAELPVGLRDLPSTALKSERDTEVLVGHARATVARSSPPLGPLASPMPRMERRMPSAGAHFGRWMEVTVGAALAPITVLSLLSLLSMLGPLEDALPFVFIVLAALLAVQLFMLPTLYSRYRDQPTTNATKATSDMAFQIFVSYSRLDGRTVDRVVHEIQQAGCSVWIDRRPSHGVERYAAPIVRAIKTSRIVVLMCSRNAFGSDHVIREIYVAGDYKKPFLLFQLDLSELPDEISYFVSGFPRVPVDSIKPGQVRSEIVRLMAG